MPGPLALIGLSDRETTMTIDRYLLEKSGGNEVLYLPTAGVEWERAALEQSCAYIKSFVEGSLGARAVIPMILSREDAHDPTHVGTIMQAKYIFIGGGRPAPMAEILRDTPVWQAIVARWYSGAVLAGESAGALVLMDRVPRLAETDGDPFIWEPGLGLLPGMRAVAHLETTKGQWILGRVLDEAPPDALVVGLPERSAVVREPDGTWITLGVDGVIVLRGGQPAAVSQLNAVQPRELSSYVSASA
jgi:cyanophycinase-like exopeptidase